LTAQNVPKDIIYNFPSVNLLSDYIVSHTLSASVSQDADNSKIRHEPILQDLIDEQSKDFPHHRAQICASSGNAYLITGSTGSLGTSFLYYLLKSLRPTDSIYLLNRKHPAASTLDRHKKSFLEKGIDFDALESAVERQQVTFWDLQVDSPQLGLDNGQYDTVGFSNQWDSPPDLSYVF